VSNWATVDAMAKRTKRIKEIHLIVVGLNAQVEELTNEAKQLGKEVEELSLNLEKAQGGTK
jgi:DNA integrity scanning protein DisA with diadenylate cyclase activity